MRVDLDRAIQAVRTAAEFDWTWELDDLTTFSTSVGWQLTRTSSTQFELTTNLDVNRQDTRIDAGQSDETDGRRKLDLISYYATDVVLDDPSVEPPIRDAFARLRERMTSSLGQPIEHKPEPDPELWWLLPHVVLILGLSPWAVDIQIVNPGYELRLGWLEEEDDLFYPEIIGED